MAARTAATAAAASAAAAAAAQQEDGAPARRTKRARKEVDYEALAKEMDAAEGKPSE